MYTISADPALIWPLRFHPETAPKCCNRNQQLLVKNTLTFVVDDMRGGPAGSATACLRAGFFSCVFELHQGARVTAINSSSNARRTRDNDHFGKCICELNVASRTDPEERKI
jgi:hypothetical protein